MALITQEPPDLDAIAADAQTRLDELRAQAQRLAPAALVEASVARPGPRASSTGGPVIDPERRGGLSGF